VTRTLEMVETLSFLKNTERETEMPKKKKKKKRPWQKGKEEIKGFRKPGMLEWTYHT
jgi:hypothetical protein